MEWKRVAKNCPLPLEDVLIAYRNLEGKMVVDMGYRDHLDEWFYTGGQLMSAAPVFYMDLQPVPEDE
ncbi:MAG TPA: hypothetical protein ENN06_12605 [Desulfobacteraceae bacterium]|nr:hypothetical protein [Desulfobacteraceae bacterium]